MTIFRGSDASKPHVVIIGAGFGGLYAAKRLAKVPVSVTVVDRCNHHLFQPLLYQVANAALSPGDIAYPIRVILKRQRNTRVLLAEAVDVDTEAKRVKLRDGEVEYDYLVVATGARHSYFGNDHWEKLAPGLKNLHDALEMRRRILLAFELAERETDAKRREALLTFVVVGGGPTGVELAGAIAEISRQVMVDEFRNIRPEDSRIILVEAGSRVLKAFDEDLSAKAEQMLRDMGVWVWTGNRVQVLENDHVMIGEQRIETATTLWAAGVSPSHLGRALGCDVDRAGRPVVRKDLSIRGHPEVFVVGDLACFETEGNGSLPGVAPVAMQQGRHAANNIARMIDGAAAEEFRYRDKGSLATIGRAAAVVDVGSIKLAGSLAWFFWLFVHVLYLSGFRNRVVVMFNWAWSYVRFQRAARLITGRIEVAEEQA